jgi:hypothetical protein
MTPRTGCSSSRATAAEVMPRLEQLNERHATPHRKPN